MGGAQTRGGPQPAPLDLIAGTPNDGADEHAGARARDLASRLAMTSQLRTSETNRSTISEEDRREIGMIEAADINLKAVYEHRFTDSDAAAKDAIWQQIGRYLQRFIPENASLLDLACDRGDFIRNVQAGEKWASDLRDVSAHLPPDVNFVRADGLTLDGLLPKAHFDVVFMSNYLEHLPSPRTVVRQFEVARDLLKPGGRVVVLQPNIRLVGGRYWDFVDHCVALTEHSLAEAAGLAGLVTERTITRFLPYTTKSRLPHHPLLVRAYLAFPPLWLLLGRQTLYVARRRPATELRAQPAARLASR